MCSDEWVSDDRGIEMGRVGALERLGMPCAVHSDSVMARQERLTRVSAAVNRETINGKLTGENERVSLEAGLRAITIDAAYVLGLEHEIGTLRAGKRADFTVLEQDPFEVGAAGLKDIEIWGTVFGGVPHKIET